MKNAKRRIAVCLLVALMLSCTALADSGLNAYCVVPKFGSEFSTGYGEKESTGSSAYLTDVTTGGGYKVDVRQCSVVGTEDPTKETVYSSGGWCGPVSTDVPSAYVEGTSRMLEGTNVRLQFKSALSTLVRVEVYGTWDTN